MLRFFKIISMSVVCLMMLSGCLTKQEKYEELNGFWLGSSLKISPYEQVEVISKIFEGKSFYDNENVEILKKLC